jgi:hypothetical protein
MRRKASPDLEACLDPYLATIQSTAGGWKQSLGNWPMYAAATGSALALSTSAGASIIHGFGNLSLSVPAAGFQLETSDFRIGPQSGSAVAYPYLFAFHRQFSGNSTFPAYRVGGVQLLASCGCTTSFFVRPYSTLVRNYPLRRFASGEMISGGGSPLFYSMGFLAAKCTGATSVCGTAGGVSVHPDFQSNVYGFAGFRAGGNYGWIRVKWEADSGNGFPNKITVLDWAYEDSGAPIAAGDTGTPEPGTMSMSLLAAGAAGIVAWRKRKKCAA